MGLNTLPKFSSCVLHVTSDYLNNHPLIKTKTWHVLLVLEDKYYTVKINNK